MNKMDVSIERLTETYRNLQQRYCLLEKMETYADLVRAGGNQDYPVQRWFHLKESFSLELLETLLNDWDISLDTIRRVLDPFCGVGTTLLACQKLAKEHNRPDLEVLGIERNPFLHFVAQTKTRWHKYNATILRSQAAYMLNGARKPTEVVIPDLSTLHRQEAFEPEALKEALRFRYLIQQHLIDRSEKDALLLGFASILEPISGLRKDGRALRIVKGKRRAKVSEALKSAWRSIADDLLIADQFFQPIHSRVFLGDGRRLVIEQNPDFDLGDFDLIFYSPPYLNNIDYTEVYKVELWMCGFISTYEEFRSQRYKTFRSHPSVRFPDPIAINADKRMVEVLSILDVLIQALPKDKDFKWRAALFRGYFDDMYQSLKRQVDVLRPGGWIFCTVGNSLHGPRDEPEARVPVAADLIIALIAQALGLDVKAIQVARYLTRRTPNHGFIRESIIVMQKH